MEINIRKSAGLLLAFIFLAACMIATIPVPASAEETENTWVPKAPMHVARSGLGVAVVCGKIYAIGGSTFCGMWPTESGGIVGVNEEYNPTMDIWTFKKTMPTPRTNFAIATYQNKIYCIGGCTDTSISGDVITNVTEVYDPQTDTWETKSPMPTAQESLQANVVGGIIYLIGGYPNGTLNLAYDPATDSWSTNANMPIAAGGITSCVTNNKIYLIGALSKNQNSVLNQIYDPETNQWHFGAASPSSVRYGAAGATTGINAPKRIYVLGKTLDLWEGEPPNFNRVYDLETNSWTFGSDILTYREGFGVAVLSDTLYVIGGFTLTYPNMQSRSTGGYVTKYATNEQYIPFGYGLVPRVVSPEANKTYVGSEIQLMFTLGKTASWLGYSLDAQDNVTMSGNTTITGLADGLHNLTVYAKDEFGNTGNSETIFFTVAEPFPALPFAVCVTSTAAVGIGTLIYLKKRRR
ncbi:MAG: kelch repeat-containing protein [Candidatus Bathyarchaeia archaeon]